MTTPYIIFSKKTCGALRSCIVENYGLIRSEFPFINALCVEVPPEKADNIKRHHLVAMMVKDAKVSKLGAGAYGRGRRIAYSGGQSKWEQLYGLLGGEGQNVTIAVIDTGVAPHYDLIKPANRLIAFKDFINDQPRPYDDDGHGTHVAGIAAGNGYSSAGQVSKGTAPMANIVGIKALDHEGNGTTSDILSAMQWVMDHRIKYNIRVVNLSLGINAQEASLADPMSLACTVLVANGITVVTAAGNSGPKSGTITSPGVCPAAITVGTFVGSRVSEFSGRGPTPIGLAKPDLVAPGVDILSLDAASCKNYLAQTGTSMSAPYIAGIVACLYSSYPFFTPLQIKRLLAAMARPLRHENRNSQGAGAVVI